MSALDKAGFLSKIALSLLNIQRRTWLIIAAVGVVLAGLLLWAIIAIFSWLLGLVPIAIETGQRMLGATVTRVEQEAPGLTDRLQQWLPGTELPAFDVSGVDVGPVPRYPGLVRNHFLREGQMVQAGYVGHVEFDAVLAHYAQGLIAAGYVQEVVSATPEGERHLFRRNQEIIDLSLLRHPGRLVELRLQHSLLP